MPVFLKLFSDRVMAASKMDKPTEFTPLDKQPVNVIIKQTNHLFVHRSVVHKAGTAMNQHSHTWDHLSFLAAGGAKVWADSKYLGEFFAPEGIVIAAGVEHMFVTTRDHTIIDCIHALHGLDDPEIAKEGTPLI
jgi:hypothetical protein